MRTKKLGGPHTSKLEEVLQSLHISGQAYHSGSFVGNHIHKMLKLCPGGLQKSLFLSKI